jgi:hypothetical protein
LKDTDKTQVDVTITVSQGEAFESLDVTTAPSFAVIAPRGPEMKIWVRNLSPDDEANPDPASAGVKTKTYPENGGNTYFSTHDDPHQRPGSILEYLVTVRAGNEEPLTDQMYQIPKPYGLEYVAGETRLNAGERIPDEDIEQGVPLSNIGTDQTAYITYQVTVIGGDGGDVDLPLTPAEIKLACNGDSPQLFSIETCKGQPWDARNGTTLEKNPVCWDSDAYPAWAEGKNPWVVGIAGEFNMEAYDCRTKCAGKSGDSFGHCAADGWWQNDAAKSTMCVWEGEDRVVGMSIIGWVLEGGGWSDAVCGGTLVTSPNAPSPTDAG